MAPLVSGSVTMTGPPPGVYPVMVPVTVPLPVAPPIRAWAPVAVPLVTTMSPAAIVMFPLTSPKLDIEASPPPIWA